MPLQDPFSEQFFSNLINSNFAPGIINLISVLKKNTINFDNEFPGSVEEKVFEDLQSIKEKLKSSGYNDDVLSPLNILLDKYNDLLSKLKLASRSYNTSLDILLSQLKQYLKILKQLDTAKAKSNEISDINTSLVRAHTTASLTLKMLEQQKLEALDNLSKHLSEKERLISKLYCASCDQEKIEHRLEKKQEFLTNTKNKFYKLLRGTTPDSTSPDLISYQQKLDKAETDVKVTEKKLAEMKQEKLNIDCELKQITIDQTQEGIIILDLEKSITIVKNELSSLDKKIEENNILLKKANQDISSVTSQIEKLRLHLRETHTELLKFRTVFNNQKDKFEKHINLAQSTVVQYGPGLLTRMVTSVFSIFKPVPELSRHVSEEAYSDSDTFSLVANDDSPSETRYSFSGSDKLPDLIPVSGLTSSDDETSILPKLDPASPIFSR